MTVLDLGSGAGIDCFIAGKKVGDSGKVIGVDMTPDMIFKARSQAKEKNFNNVQFRLGEIVNTYQDPGIYLMIPFIKDIPQLSFDYPIDSISVSGHKMLGCPMPCGVIVTRKENINRLENKIDYLNSLDTTIMGSRNGQTSLYLWYGLRKKGYEGIKKEVLDSINKAKYMNKKMKEKNILSFINNNSSTVIFEKPNSLEFIKKWQLACESDIAHVIVMPNITENKIDKFINEFLDCIQKYGHIDIMENGQLVKLKNV